MTQSQAMTQNWLEALMAILDWEEDGESPWTESNAPGYAVRLAERREMSVVSVEFLQELKSATHAAAQNELKAPLKGAGLSRSPRW